MDILKLQKSFIWLYIIFYINLRKPTSHNVFRTFEWMYGE